jgi:hypothetical protein
MAWVMMLMSAKLMELSLNYLSTFSFSYFGFKIGVGDGLADDRSLHEFLQIKQVVDPGLLLGLFGEFFLDSGLDEVLDLLRVHALVDFIGNRTLELRQFLVV